MLTNNENFPNHLKYPVMRIHYYIHYYYHTNRILQVRKDSNPQLPALEAGALPIELLTYAYSVLNKCYFVSLNITCFLITGSYFLYSTRSGCNRLFFVME